jgi:Spy/CpxP family protein refolding chaperone
MTHQPARQFLWLFVALPLAAAAQAGPSAGSDSPHHPHHHPGMDGAAMGMMPWTGVDGAGGRMFHGLNLTAEQRQAISDLQQTYRPRWQELRRRAEAIRDAFSSVSPDDDGYAASTEKARRDIAELAGDVVTAMAELRADIHAILTDEQRAQLQQQMKNRRERWESWRSRSRPSS